MITCRELLDFILDYVEGELPELLLCLTVIGLGTGLPWGLMDGLALSVVPKERAGMAAGIFNTTRVAGEGVALAMALAILSTLIEGQLAQALAISQESSR